MVVTNFHQLSIHFFHPPLFLRRRKSERMIRNDLFERWGCMVIKESLIVVYQDHCLSLVILILRWYLVVAALHLMLEVLALVLVECVFLCRGYG